MEKCNMGKILKKQSILFITLFSLLSFTSCKDDDGYSVGDIAIDWVTVNVESNGVYSFTGDTWGTMWPAATSIWGYKPIDGERAFLYFNPLYDNFDGYDHAIKPEAIYPILTKKVEELTEDNEKDFADHPAYISDIWISGGYMNMMFMQRVPKEYPHRVSLVKNTTLQQEEDGYIHLEYRYNTYGDTLSSMPFVKGAVSYSLSSLEIAESKGIKLRINSAVNGERVLTFDKKDTPAPASAIKSDISLMKAE